MVMIPVLRKKDFTVDPYMIAEHAVLNASAVLTSLCAPR